nr:hypothetical protein [Tanacetum cinerariifolium]
VLAAHEGVTSLYIDTGDYKYSREHCGARFSYGEQLKGYSIDRRVVHIRFKAERQKQDSRSEGIPKMGESKATKASTN